MRFPAAVRSVPTDMPAPASTARTHRSASPLRRAALSVIAGVALSAVAATVYASDHEDLTAEEILAQAQAQAEAEANEESAPGTVTQTQSASNSSTLTQSATVTVTADGSAGSVNVAGPASATNTASIVQSTAQTGGGTQSSSSSVAVTQSVTVTSTVDGVTEVFSDTVTTVVSGDGKTAVSVTVQTSRGTPLTGTAAAMPTATGGASDGPGAVSALVGVTTLVGIARTNLYRRVRAAAPRLRGLLTSSLARPG